MPWRYHGQARVDPNNPQGFGICDRCNFTYNLVDLHWQYQWRGISLINTRFRVCSKCMDVPSAFLKAILLPEDPKPLLYPRPNTFPTQMNAGNPASVWDTADASWDSDQGSGVETFWDGV